MKDEEILALYAERSEDAIKETDHKYGKLCRKIANGILNDSRDSEECVNDTWKTVWNTIPPKKPNPLIAYICRVAKNLSLKKYEYNTAGKRNSEYESSLDELEDCISSSAEVERTVEQKELSKLINEFLDHLPKEKRILFMRRYWFMHSVKDIAKDNGISENGVSMRLARIREQLKDYLIKEGYTL